MRELAETLIKIKEKNKSFDFGMLEDEILLSDENSLQATLEDLDEELFVECMITILKNII